MTTEAEAKEKWCPMARAQFHSQVSATVNRRPEIAEDVKCLGSECMMWRWHHIQEEKKDPKRPMAGAQVHVSRSEHGYCGLAPADVVLV